jgi:two-component system, OmpR family, sensor kinase
MHRRSRTLRSRLFTWFVGAIVMAMATSALVVVTTRPEPATGAEAMAQNVSLRLTALWADPAGVRAYLNEIRDVTGFDVRLVSDPHEVPPRGRRVAERGGWIVLEGMQRMFIPVLVGGQLVGGLEMDRFGRRVAPWAWWRFALAIGLLVLLLSAMAGAVANQLAEPLERLARAADRFGGGDLAFRTDVGGRGGRWVAQEVRDVAVRFNRMAEGLEAMVRGQRELLGAISHELRSPMARARVALEITRDRLSAEGETGGDASPRAKAAESLDELEKQLVAIDAILGDLLDVARSGLADLRKERRDILAWLRERASAEPSPPLYTVTVAGPAAIEVDFDAALLARAVQNMFVNARAHGHAAGSPVEVHVARAGDVVHVVVRDRGAGFPDGFAPRAFEPFVRGDTSRARPSVGGGYGLGLAIVRRVVEAHGGKVFARNAEDGPGAEVGFDLPMASVDR